ncbi:MAG: CRISPR system precrRNA processing endoribonuclease RAMP protein Cas6 [Methyloprofundus sp.]|nr:CRISPR system precrRNA processing endoribonuclease RAMP protein Cas6 [Methyloprofundus sp.]
MMNLPVNRYQFNFAVETPLHLNFYSGSMLRGAFGHALRHISCMTKIADCKTCPLYRTCPYPAIFETPPPENHSLQLFSDIPPPYVIEPPALGSKDYLPGDILSFSMVLIGKAIEQLPLIIYAWQRALTQGLGKSRSRARLIDVTLILNQTGASKPIVIYSAQEGASVINHQHLANKDRLEYHDALPQSLTLSIKTPLRIQKKGQLLAHDMSGRDFIMSLVRRYYLLEEFHYADYQAPDFSALAELAQAVSCETQFRWCDWARYSNRQQQKMILGGVLGKIKLSGQLQPFLPLIQLGQWLHAGNKTTFGMGLYTIEKT